MLTVLEAAALAGVGRQRIVVLLKAGRVAGERISPRLWLVDEPSLREWMADPAQHRAGRKTDHPSGAMR